MTVSGVGHLLRNIVVREAHIFRNPAVPKFRGQPLPAHQPPDRQPATVAPICVCSGTAPPPEVAINGSRLRPPPTPRRNGCPAGSRALRACAASARHCGPPAVYRSRCPDRCMAWWFLAPLVAGTTLAAAAMSAWTVWVLRPGGKQRGALLCLRIGSTRQARRSRLRSGSCTTRPSPSWLSIPARSLVTGVCIVGAVGSGKTSACMHPCSVLRRDCGVGRQEQQQ